MKYEFLIYKIGFLKFMIFIIWFILLFFQLLSLHSNQICNVFQPFNASFFIFIIPFWKDNREFDKSKLAKHYG